MRSFILLVLVLVTPVASLLSQNVAIPDTAFLYALIDVGVDTNEDSLISYNEAESVTNLWIMNRGITDMTGIEAFVMLDSLICDNNNIETLTLSTLSELTVLSCGLNPIDSLDLFYNPGLTDLYAYYSNLTFLDLSNNPLLKILSCEFNQFSNLDVSANVNLDILWCHDNPLESLDVSTNVNLQYMNCSTNNLESLDVSNNLRLKELHCQDNYKIETLDVSKNDSLEYLYCGQVLTSLILPDSSALRGLYCFYNLLDSIDVSGCPYLEDFRPFDNNITSLDLSNNPLLQILSCEQNQLSDLDVSNNPELSALWCGDNLLTTLDLLQNSKIGTVPWTFDHLNIDNMPTLGEVCVWDGFPGDAEISFEGSPNVCFESGDACNGVCDWIGSSKGFVDSELMIYPNPTTDLLTIETVGFGPHSIQLHSLNGQEIYATTFTGSLHEIDLSSFRKGMYILNIRSGNLTATRKVVKL